MYHLEALLVVVLIAVWKVPLPNRVRRDEKIALVAVRLAACDHMLYLHHYFTLGAREAKYNTVQNVKSQSAFG